MTSVNQLEKLHKEIFNNLTEEELDVYLKTSSEERFKHINFISEDGTITSDMAKYFELDKLEADLLLDVTSFNKKIAVVGTAITYDYINLAEKYNKQFKTALAFYHKSTFKDVELIKHLVKELEDLLATYEEEPSEALYNLLKDVALSTAKPFEKAKANIDSYFINIAVITEGIEEFSQLKELIEKDYSKYYAVVMEIEKVDLPEGSVENG